MENKEEWKRVDIKTQFGNTLDFLVSNTGRVKYPQREVLTRWGNYRKTKEREAKYSLANTGYLRCSAGLVHRIVAQVWLDTPEGWEDTKSWVVNHKDGNKKNNHYTNLEWVSHKENCRHYFDSDKSIEDGKSQPVEVWHKNGEWVGVFQQCYKAGEALGILPQSINSQLSGKTKLTGGYIIKRITPKEYHAKKDKKRL